MGATPLDVLVSANIFSQVIKDRFNGQHVRDMNKIIGHLHATSEYTLKYKPLDLKKAMILVFSDAAYANHPYLETEVTLVSYFVSPSLRLEILGRLLKSFSKWISRAYVA